MSDQPEQWDEARALLERRGAEGLGQLFADHRARLRAAVGLRMHGGLQGRIDPSDVIQEAFLEAHQRLDEYLQGSGYSPYLWIRFLTLQKLQIQHRRHLDAQQRDARREVSLNTPQSPEVSSILLASMIADRQETPSKELQREELLTQLQQALQMLEPLDREVLALRHFEHLKNPEAAQVLEISEAAASQRYYRALKKLKAVLTDLYGEEG